MPSQAAVDTQRCAAHLHEQAARACRHPLYAKQAACTVIVEVQRPCKWQLLQQTRNHWAAPRSVTVCARELQTEQAPAAGGGNLPAAAERRRLSPESQQALPCSLWERCAAAPRQAQANHPPQSQPLPAIVCKAPFLQAGAPQSTPARVCQQRSFMLCTTDSKRYQRPKQLPVIPLLGCDTHLGADMDMVERPMSLMLCTTEATPKSSSLLTRAMTSSCGLQQPHRNLRRNW